MGVEGRGEEEVVWLRGGIAVQVQYIAKEMWDRVYRYVTQVQYLYANQDVFELVN